MNPEVKHNLGKLDDFVKGLSKHYIVKVGIIGSDGSEDHGGVNNAEIGAVHEFGSYDRTIPKRSFLRMPLFQRTEAILDYVKRHSLEALSMGNFKQVFKNLGIACENVIDQAFESSGFGSWKKLKPQTIRRKISNNPMPLVNTEQLRRSISSLVEEK